MMQNKDQLWTNMTLLRTNLLEYNDLYRRGEPQISDTQYDNMLMQYKHFVSLYYDTHSEEIDLEGMSSMNSAYDVASILHFVETINKKVHDATFVLEPKVDGVSIFLTYNEGKLFDAVCRSQSTSVLPTLLETCINLPLTCEALKNIPNAVVRAELCVNKDVFKHFSSDFVSARNIVASILMTKEKKITNIKLSLLVFDVDQRLCESHIQRLNMIKSCFEIMPTLHVSKCIDKQLFVDLSIWCQQWKYFCDGIVIKVDENAKRNTLHHTASAPRWAFAFKFVRQHYKCRLLNIEYDIGRTGRLSVLGIVDVQIEGRNINKVNMHSIAFIQRNNIKLNDVINIEYKGDAAPVFENVAVHCGDIDLILPQNCMFCDSALQQKGEHMFCINNNCSQRCYRNLLYQARCLKIDMLGKAIAKRMSVDKIRDILDIEQLSIEDIAKFSLSLVTAAKIHKNIHQRISNLCANDILISLGIPLLAQSATNKIALLCKQKNINLQQFIEYFANNDCSIVLGKKLCENIIEFLRYNSHSNTDLIHRYITRFGSLKFL